jgi:hypothetical protein
MGICWRGESLSEISASLGMRGRMMGLMLGGERWEVDEEIWG